MKTTGSHSHTDATAVTGRETSFSSFRNFPPSDPLCLLFYHTAIHRPHPLLCPLKLFISELYNVYIRHYAFSSPLALPDTPAFLSLLLRPLLEPTRRFLSASLRYCTNRVLWLFKSVCVMRGVIEREGVTMKSLKTL